MFRLCIVFVLFISSSLSNRVLAGEFFGNKMLEVLGEDKSSETFKKFKTQYILDKALKNPELGIKLSAAHDSVSIITSIMTTAFGNEVNDIKYKQFDGPLPFNISFGDDAEALTQKLGTGRGNADDVKMRFKKDGITINVFFKSAAKKKINYIKFSQAVGMIGPYKAEGSHEIVAPTVSKEVAPSNMEASTKMSIATKSDLIRKDVATNRSAMTALPNAAEFTKTTAVNRKATKSEFYNAIMNVIESGEEEMFKDIKKGNMGKGNFWNYKYTYATNVNIPGEKYNMIYSFPFQSSQLDFVSVLEETEGSNNTPIDGKYAEIENKLKDDFKLTEGWTYHYTLNPEDPKGLKDFEVKNPKLGSIVLDYSISPYGKRVLYLRFLLQYN